MTKTNNRFKRGVSGSGCYTCRICGKKTRETGLGESDCQLCAYCCEASGLENNLNDGVISEEKYKLSLDTIKIRYGR
jgi:hypothetical protein